MYTYEDAVKQLQETGSIGLIDFKELSYEDLDELLEEIKNGVFMPTAIKRN